MKLELRAMTNSHVIRESAVMISSTMPSAKYSCSGSPLILVKASTAIDGLSGSVTASLIELGCARAATGGYLGNKYVSTARHCLTMVCAPSPRVRRMSRPHCVMLSSLMIAPDQTA